MKAVRWKDGYLAGTQACVRLLQVCCQGGDKKGLKALESVPAAQEAEGKNRRVWRQGLQMARLPSANPKPA